MRATRLMAAALLAATSFPPAWAETVRFNAAQSPDTPESGYLQLGTAKAPDGTVLGANSRYLTLDGKAWLPVMGEIHFTRLPAQRWDDALGKIKASGVDIVATYLFWNYHEEKEGHFDFAGDKDLRRFLQLAQQHGLKVVLRLGPWAHGEVRFGGEPDWVVHAMPTRGNDPTYLSYVERYWTQIAAQSRGLLWKDGGPVIGVQLENEYNLQGPGRGREHIAALKQMALKLGFDVPFYTVTGWDATIYPARAVTPVFGGYPDEPWGITNSKLPPKETYAFRFNSRVSGNLGAQTQGGSAGDADADIRHTPFLGAEFGGGLPTMYRRRPVVTPDDIASMLPVQLGSGVNLYGYYMYHGGRNLIQGTTMEESSAIGGFNDLPLIDYDFQAPLGEYDQANPVLPYLRPFHLFLKTWGADLAPMTVRAPDVQPRALDDLTTIRSALRSDGHAGFLFVNNHVRQYHMAPQRAVQFSVTLADRTVTFPEKPVDIPSDAYFIWPVGLGIADARIDWATLQPLTQITAEGRSNLVFSSVEGIAPQIAISAARSVTSTSGQVARRKDGWLVSGIKPGLEASITVVTDKGERVTLLVLPPALARQASMLPLAGQERLLVSDAEVNAMGQGISLRSIGTPQIDMAVMPALSATPAASGKLIATGKQGAFQTWRASFAPRQVAVAVRQIRQADAVPPVMIGGPAKGAVPPYPESFGKAAAWSITLPADALQGLDDGFLRLDWSGDVARLLSGGTLLDDRFYDGRVWSAGLSEHRDLLKAPLTLTIMPLRADSPIYIEDSLRPAMASGTQMAVLKSASFVPAYRIDIGQ